MPDNSLAPPNMPWLWQPNSPVGQPNGLGPAMPYAVAQGAMGSRVPPDTMTDTSPLMVNPDVTPQPAPPSDKYQAEAARHAQMLSAIQQMQSVSRQMDHLPPGSPDRARLFQQWSTLSDQVGQLQQQFTTGPIGQWAQRQADTQNNQGADANAILDAIKNRQAQPRIPLQPPAPGGVPLTEPSAPLNVPTTRDWMS